MKKQEMICDIIQLQRTVKSLSARVFELECPQGWRVTAERWCLGRRFDRIDIVYETKDYKTIIGYGISPDVIYSYSKSGDVVSIMETYNEEVTVKHFVISDGKAIEINYAGDVNWVELNIE